MNPAISVDDLLVLGHIGRPLTAAMDIQAPVSRWVLGAAVALVWGALLDVVGLMPADWARADTDTYVMTMGLWRVCLATRNGTGQQAGWDAPRCTFPSQTAAGK